jgi:hypothetical protein
VLGRRRHAVSMFRRAPSPARASEPVFSLVAALLEPGSRRVDLTWTAPDRDHNPADFVALFWSEQGDTAVAWKQLGSSSKGSVTFTDADGLPDVWSAWPYHQSTLVARIVTHGNTRAEEKVLPLFLPHSSASTVA